MTPAPSASHHHSSSLTWLRRATAFLTLLLLFVVSLFIGVGDLPISSLFDGSLFTNHDYSELLLISRLPRTITIMLTGVALSTSGMVIQMVVHNRFVGPSTAGTTEGATVGILLAVLFFPSWSIMGKMLLATACSALSLLGFFTLARKVPPQDPLMLPLVGIVYGSVVGAFITFVAYEFDLLSVIGTWFSGDFSGVLRGRYEHLILAGIASFVLYLLADQLTIVGMGQKLSQSLGVSYRQLVMAAMLMVAMMTSLVVITVGTVPFLGLVVPNIARHYAGDNLRKTLPWVAWLGTISLLLCDILARSIRYPYEIPVSVLFGAFGSAFFLVLLFRSSNSAG